MEIYLDSADEPVCVDVWFKSIYGPPEKEVPMDFINDISASFGHDVQHVELRLPSGKVYTANIADGVRRKIDKDHRFVSKESRWIGYSIRMNHSEAVAILNFCKAKEGTPYSIWNLACSFCPRFMSMRCTDETKYTCTSFCFVALMQSATFSSLMRAIEPENLELMEHKSFYNQEPPDLLRRIRTMQQFCDRSGSGYQSDTVTGIDFEEQYDQLEKYVCSGRDVSLGRGAPRAAGDGDYSSSSGIDD